MQQIKTDTRRALSQVIFRHTPGSMIILDDFNIFAKVKEISGEPDSDVNKELLFKAITRFADNWREESDGRVKGFESHMTQSSFTAIRPKGFSEDAPAIFCELLFPVGFQCVNEACGIYISSKDTGFNGSCHRCNSSLKQMKYVWFHLCGRIFSLAPLKQITCPNHGQKYLYLNDTRRFATSTWRCRECNSIDKGLGMMGCSDCILTPEERQKSQQYFRGSVWNDSWVYYTQTVSFVNLESSSSNDLLISPESKNLIADSLTGRFEAGGSRITKSINSTIKCKKCGQEINRSSKFCPNCGEKQLQFNQATTEKEVLQNVNLTPDSSLVTFVTLRDLERTLSAKDIQVNASNGRPSASISSAIPLLKSSGIDDVLLIQDFPLTTAAIGFSRLNSGPPAWLNSFPSAKATGTKVPVYTNCITSEAWMIKLSAKQIIAWLKENKLLAKGKIDDADFETEEEATLWLVGKLASENKNEDDQTLYQWVYSLLHSYAHLTLQLLGVNSGLDSSSLGEMLLPEALSYIIYAGEGDIGGLSATFNQGLGIIADELVDFARVCKFDPSCQNDDSGVCVGCLYTARGCVNFNNDLSRSYLYGGQVEQDELKQKIKVGFIDIEKITND